MFLVLVKTDAAGIKRCLPRLSTVTPLTAEVLERNATADLKRAQLFSATPVSLSGETVLRLDPAPPPGLEDWQAHAVSLRLPGGAPSEEQGGHEDART